jgi:integrase/recombinase XerC
LVNVRAAEQSDDRWLDAFAAQLAARGAPKTTQAYLRDAKKLLAELKSTYGANVSLEKTTAHDIRRVLATLHGKGLSGRSLARMLSAWRAWFACLRQVAPQVFPTDPCAGLHAPKSPKRLPSALTPEEAEQFMNVPGDAPLDVRDRALVELLYSSGLRVSECIGLNVDRVSLREGEARVLGKGRKERIVPVGRKAIDALEAWFAVRAQIVSAHADADANAVFVNPQGRRLAVRTVQSRLKALSIKQTMAEGVHPHRLRHSFASHVLQSSGDLRAVQEMMGHASIASTQVYTHLDFQHLAKVYDAAHPRAKKK